MYKHWWIYVFILLLQLGELIEIEIVGTITVSGIFYILWFFGISRFCLLKLNKKYNNNYIRIVNYHFSPKKNIERFVKQIRYLSKYFVFCDKNDLLLFLSNKKKFFSKPGLIITFDDGLKEHYYAYQELNKLNIKAFFMISSQKIGSNGYLTKDEIVDISENGFEICDHTHSHHRMEQSDSELILKTEITDSKLLLENIINKDVDVFCWCGGEIGHYTKKAFDYIKYAGFKYGMTTHSNPIFNNTNPYILERTNIEWNFSKGKTLYSICGLLDRRIKRNREYKNSIIFQESDFVR